VEAHLTTIDSREVIRGGHRREDIVCSRNVQAVASQPLWRKETKGYGAGAIAPLGAHLHYVERYESGELSQF
jgi:hypothetical protein